MNKLSNRKKRHIRISKKIRGTTEKPRIAVYRSNKYIQVQLIDDISHKTLVGMSTLKVDSSKTKTEQAKALGVEFAKSVLEKTKNDSVVFDRGGYKYHGRIKAFADSLRENGLKF